MLPRLLILLTVAAAATPALAGSITAELDRTEASLGEALLLTVSVEGVRESDPTMPQVQGLVINQQGISESTIFSNGHRVSELQLTFAVYPQQAGQFTIPSITIQVDGKQEATLPLTLKIHPAGQDQDQGQGQGQTPGGAAPNSQPGGQQNAQQAPQQGHSKGAKGKLEDTGGVFIERECDKGEVYAGEQVICAIRVYHRGNLNGGQRVSQSSADLRRFSVEGEKRYQRLVNGQRYGVIELKEIVVPTKAGNIELPPYTIDARILTYSRKNNPLDKFFDKFGGGVFNFDMGFSEEKDVTVKSEATPLVVKPLPAAGKPPGFGGLVGSFQLAANVSKATIPAGDTVTITITIQGDGVSDMLPDPAPSLSNFGKVYPDKPEVNEQISPDHGIHSSRTYKYALVPSQPGTVDLGSVDVPSFNPKLGQYVMLHADLGRLIVEPGKAEEKPLVVGQPAASSTPEKQEAVKELGKDLLGLHRTQNLSAQQTITKNNLIFLNVAASIPTLFAFSFLGVTALRNRRGVDLTKQRRSKAYRTFCQAAHAAEAEVAAGNLEAGLTQAYAAFKTYLGDKQGLHGTSLAAREMTEQLSRLGATPEAQALAADAVASLEAVEFGGRLPPPAKAAALLNTLNDLVGGLEKA